MLEGEKRADEMKLAEKPEWIVPQFIIKAVRYPGNKIHVSDYLDFGRLYGALKQNIRLMEPWSLSSASSTRFSQDKG
jgi:hypothetical protein